MLKTLIILLEKDSTIDIIDLFVTYDISTSGQYFKICVAFLLTYINKSTCPIVQIPSAYLDCWLSSSMLVLDNRDQQGNICTDLPWPSYHFFKSSVTFVINCVSTTVYVQGRNALQFHNWKCNVWKLSCL